MNTFVASTGKCLAVVGTLLVITRCNTPSTQNQRDSLLVPADTMPVVKPPVTDSSAVITTPPVNDSIAIDPRHQP